MLSERAIDAVFAPLEAAGSLLVAVSGGPDSLALLLLTLEWAKRRSPHHIVAATVDHGLRPASATEAEDVAALCARLGVEHHTLVWAGPKPKTRVQERARDARYALLAECARREGVGAILTAHHADDQAETILFRLARGSGLTGLAGIASRTTRDGVTLFRPLLGVPKADLIALCKAQGVDFIDDPSNVDPRYARARLRPLLADLAREGLDSRAFGRLAQRMRRADEAIEQAVLAADARLGAGPSIDGRRLIQETPEVALRILQRRMTTAGGGRRTASLAAFEALEGRLRAAIQAGRSMRANVGGAEAAVTESGQLHVGPETARRRRAGTPVSATRVAPSPPAVL